MKWMPLDELNVLYEGNIENVLMKIRQSTNFGKDVLENVKHTHDCKQCPVYDELDKEIEELLKTQNPTEGNDT